MGYFRHHLKFIVESLKYNDIKWKIYEYYNLSNILFIYYQFNTFFNQKILIFFFIFIKYIYKIFEI